MYSEALRAFLAEPASKDWRDLPFFGIAAQAVVAKVDARADEGAQVLPPPGDVFNALRLSALGDIRVVILGQDPYPTPGDANGLAFSYVGEGRLPPSLRNIFKELADDEGGPVRTRGDLSDWARQGVLLLNTALTVEARAAGAHLAFGWHELTQQAVKAASDQTSPCAFILWGSKAIAYRDLIDEGKHLVHTSVHPSPLSARGGFFGSKPFSKVNAWLRSKGENAIAWQGEVLEL